jgi:sugar lactone lactonase YvrE
MNPISKLILLFTFLAMFATASEAQTVTTVTVATGYVSDALSVDRAGNIYASDYAGTANGNGTTVYKIKASGDSVTAFVTNIAQPVGSTFDAAGNFYVCESGGTTTGRIYKVTPAGVKTVFAQAGLAVPAGLAFASNGILYSSQFNQPIVVRIDASGTVLDTTTGFTYPVNLVFDNAGNLYVNSFFTGIITKITPTGTRSTLATIPTLSGGGISTMCYGAGNIFIGSNTNKIYRVSMSGQVTVLAGTGAAGSNDGPALSATFNGSNGLALSPTGDTLYVADYNTKRLRRISGILAALGIKESHDVKPKSFGLLQNYPNPFNPTTTIGYEVATSSFVSMKVYDVLGREVATLVNEKKSAGHYDVAFQAGKLSSGIYFYRLQAGDFSDTKKLILAK